MESNQRIITSIERQVNRPRYNVYVNHEYSFAVHQDILIKFNLSKGKEIGEEDIQYVLKAEEQHRAEQVALRYLGFKPRTVAQLRDYLGQKGFEPEDCEVVIQSFMEKKYIDDEDYAKQWVEERKRMKPRGRYLLKQELIYRGVEETLIEGVINKNVTDDEETAMMMELINKKWKNKNFSNLFDMKKKMVPYLQRKGFRLELIIAAILKISPGYVQKENEME